MKTDSSLVELSTLSAKIGQYIRSNELKVAGKLLATARTNLHQLAEKDRIYQPHFEKVAELRNELMEPATGQFDEKKLLVELLEEEEKLHKLVAHHHTEPLVLADAMLRAASAIVLVYAQDMAGDAPLEI